MWSKAQRGRGHIDQGANVRRQQPTVDISSGKKEEQIEDQYPEYQLTDDECNREHHYDAEDNPKGTGSAE